MARSRVGGMACPQRSLSTLDAGVMVVGLVIGVGIFRAPQLVAANAGSPSWFVALWILGGAVSLVGALCYAELAAAYPHAGGEYHFLSRAFGRPVGFLFGWSRMTVIQTGSIAILAFVLGDYAAGLLPFGPAAAPPLAAATVVVLTAVNVLGLREGRGAQYVLTSIEVLGLGAVILAGLVFSAPDTSAATAGEAAADGAGGPHLGLALVFVLLTFGGWSEAAYLSAEVRDRTRGIPHTLIRGIGLITVLYLLANAAYLSGLGLAGLAGSSVPAADLVGSVAGRAGAAAVSVLVMVSALSSANATIITGARSNYALGRDFQLFAYLGTWRDRAGTPAHALLVQGAIALALVGFGTLARSGFETMVAYTAPVFWTILLLTGAALIVLRARDGGTPRPFRVPLYPAVPLAFCATSAFMLYSSVTYAGPGAILGVIVMLAGLPVLRYARPRPLLPASPPDPARTIS